jgi:hypothetical protein
MSDTSENTWNNIDDAHAKAFERKSINSLALACTHKLIKVDPVVCKKSQYNRKTTTGASENPHCLDVRNRMLVSLRGGGGELRNLKL